MQLDHAVVQLDDSDLRTGVVQAVALPELCGKRQGSPGLKATAVRARFGSGHTMFGELWYISGYTRSSDNPRGKEKVMTEPRIRSRCTTVLAVLFVLSASGATGQNLERDSAYEMLDANAERVITEFADARAVSTRTDTGDLETILTATDGGELARMSFSKGVPSFVFEDGGGRSPRIDSPPSLVVTADWANAQLYSLWRDRTLEDRRRSLPVLPTFDGQFFRPPGLSVKGEAAGEHYRETIEAVRKVTSEFSAIVAISERNSIPEPPLQAPGSIHSEFTARLFDRTTGLRLGILQWFPEVQSLSWKLSGLTEGFVTPERLRQGHLTEWPFRPNPAWANLQMFAFYTDHGGQELAPAMEVSTSSSSGLGSSRVTVLGPWRGLPLPPTMESPWSSQLTPRATSPASQLSPKNEPGCDSLHWLDGSIFKQCCNYHDHCYGYDEDGDPTVPEPCSWRSWLFLEGWDCMGCNVGVIWCFLTGGAFTDDPYDDDPGAGGSCNVGPGGYCPAECSTCY